jgi:hypothetical protein
MYICFRDEWNHYIPKFTSDQLVQRVSLLGSHFSKNADSTITTRTAKMTEAKSDIHLYTDQTANGIKISMLLEELGVPYKVPCHSRLYTWINC